MTTPGLFSRCPACRRNPVADPREPCGECIEAFGPMLRRRDQHVSAGEFARLVAEGDAGQARRLVSGEMPAGERRRLMDWTRWRDHEDEDPEFEAQLAAYRNDAEGTPDA